MNNAYKLIIHLCLCLFITFTNSTLFSEANALYEINTDFLMTSVDEESIEFEMKFTRKEIKGYIQTFDVSDSGYVAVGFNDKEINIYDDNLNFLYSIEPSYTHCSYSIKWLNNSLYVYIKSDILFNCIVINGYNNVDYFKIADSESNCHLFNNLDCNVDYLEDDNYIYSINNSQLERLSKTTSSVEKITNNFYFDKTLLLLPIVIPVCIYVWKNKNKFKFKNIKKRV